MVVRELPIVSICGSDVQSPLHFADGHYLFRVSKYPQFALYLALIGVHLHLLLPNDRRLKEMSRELRHIYPLPIEPESSHVFLGRSLISIKSAQVRTG